MKNKKILIVDDEPKNLKILRIRLESDFELVEASSGEEALEKLKNFKPAVVLLDVMMPGIDGFETTAKIRAQPEFAHTKIILVSGKAMIDDKLEGYNSGADDYMTKPFDGEELRAKVSTFMKMYDYEIQLKELNSSLEDQVRIRSEQLFRSERLAHVGRHACDIVHNLKNPLAILISCLDRMDNAVKAESHWISARKATQRILLIVSDILSANGTEDVMTVETNLSQTILEELELLKLDAFVKYNLKSETQLNAKSLVAISPTHLHQVIGNLVKNAAEALYGTQNGKIVVKSEDINGAVKIVVQDTGPGISPENMKRIFSPLFTTKKGENGGPVGNGLGLSYTKRIIESYHGKLVLTSTLGQGTTVEVVLPKATSSISGQVQAQVQAA